MIKWVLGIFIVLWLFGFIQVPLLNFTLFSLAGHPFTLRSLLLFGLIIYFINFLPGILRTLAIIILILWLLSQFGFFIAGALSNLLLLIIIVIVIFSIL